MLIYNRLLPMTTHLYTYEGFGILFVFRKKKNLLHLFTLINLFLFSFFFFYCNIHLHSKDHKHEKLYSTAFCLNAATVILHSFCEHCESMYTSKVIQNNSFSSKIDMFYDKTLQFCAMNELLIHIGLNKINNAQQSTSQTSQ